MLDKKEIALSENIKISYLDNELLDKSVLFFVHGWGADKYNLQSIFTSLRHDFRIISIDLPGFGESSFPNYVYGSKEYADLIYDFIKKLNITEVNYIGHSFGGKIGILLSADYPDLIKRLVLIDSSGLRSKRNIDWYFKVGLYKTVKFITVRIVKSEKMLEILRNKIGSDDYKNAGSMRNVLVKSVQEDFSIFLKRIKCPVFLYWGEKDKATPLWMAKKMERLIPDSALHVVKNGGHFSFLDDNRIIDIIKAFAV